MSLYTVTYVFRVATLRFVIGISRELQSVFSSDIIKKGPFNDDLVNVCFAGSVI